MTQLQDIQNIVDLDIKSLEQIIAESKQPGRYKRLLRIQEKLKNERKAPSLSAYLLYEYQFGNRSAVDLGNELGYTNVSILNLLKKMNIPIKTISESREPGRPSYGELYGMYVYDGLSDIRISKKLGCKKTSVYRWRKEYGIKGRKKRTKAEKQNMSRLASNRAPPTNETRMRISKGLLRTEKLSKDELFYLSVIEELTDTEIAELIGCSHATVFNWRKEYEIPGRRLHSETIREVMSEAQKKRLMDPIERLRLIEMSKNRCVERYTLNGNYFDSKSEAAAGILLQKYIPNYRLQKGNNFQANGDTFCIFDFVIPKAIVEWHPINLRYDLKRNEDRTALRELEESAKTPDEKKSLNELRSQIESDAAVEYWIRRQDASDKSQIYKGKEVILVTNFNELYDQVLSRYCNKYVLPSKSEIRREFGILSKQAIKIDRRKK